MKIQTSELQGAALDWAVAKCERVEFTYEDHPHHEMFDMHYSTNWAQGGPIIEREGINIGSIDALNGPYWETHMPYGMSDDFADGPTPLIAAMRCYVASKLGEEIEIPEELNHASMKRQLKMVRA